MYHVLLLKIEIIIVAIFAKNMLTLRKLVGINALRLFVAKDLTTYYTSDFIREFNTFQTYHTYPIEMFYLGCFVSILVYKIYEKTPKESKLAKINEFNQDIWCIRLFILVFAMIFTRDIENAI